MSNPNDRIIFTRSNLQALINEIKAEIVAPAVNNIFPVGFVYITSKAPNDGGDPNNLFPGTTWVRIKDTLIYAAGDNDTVTSAQGAEGHMTAEEGSFTSLIGANNLPQHTHSLGGNTGDTQPTFSGTQKTLSASTSFTVEGRRFADGSDVVFSSDATKTLSSASYRCVQAVSSGSNASTLLTYNKSHSHTYIPAGTVESHSHTLPTDTGNNTTTATALSVKNPLIKRYCWERTTSKRLPFKVAFY